MTKRQIDNYFTLHSDRIANAIQRCNKATTRNKHDITSDVYLICLERAQQLEVDKIDQFIRGVIYNTYNLHNSQYNRLNKSIANDNLIHDIPANDDKTESVEVQYQNLEYLFTKYLQNCTTSERYFYELYVNKNIRSVRKVAKKLNISHYGAYVLINDFKAKIKSYER